MVKLGMIGCGGIGNLHMGFLKKIKGVEVLAISDVNEEKLHFMKNRFKIKYTFSDFRKLLKIGEIDGIICTTPTYLHSLIVTESAKAKKDIFCEKPMAMTLKDADRMIESCEKHNVKLQIGFVRRFDKEWVKFKELIKSGIIGRPVIWRSISGSSGPGNPWFHDIKKGGGPFIDGAVHSYDFALYTFGNVKEIKSSLIKFRKRTTAPDTGFVNVKFSGGDHLLLNWSWGLPPGCHSSGINEAIGPGGVLIFGGVQSKKYKWFVVRKNGGKEEKTGRTPIDTLTKGFQKQMEHFVDCIKNNKKPVVGGLEGRKSLEVGLEVLRKWKLTHR